MTDKELMQQALEALKFYYDQHGEESDEKVITALCERLAQPNEFNPDWDSMAVMVEEQQRMATEIDNLKWRLKTVNSAAMNLAHDLVCMEVDDDERLDRGRVMGRIMQWRNEWDKAMHNNQPQMQPCAGRNCGSTNPNLHSAECFEDYEKSTGMNQWQGLTDEDREEILRWVEWKEIGSQPVAPQKLIAYVEKKLKEKNT